MFTVNYDEITIEELLLYIPTRSMIGIKVKHHKCNQGTCEILNKIGTIKSLGTVNKNAFLVKFPNGEFTIARSEMILMEGTPLRD